MEQDGERWFHNKALNVSRWNLTDEEAGLNGGVLPLLDPYDNELVMSLRVRPWGAAVGCGWAGEVLELRVAVAGWRWWGRGGAGMQGTR